MPEELTIGEQIAAASAPPAVAEASSSLYTPTNSYTISINIMDTPSGSEVTSSARTFVRRHNITALFSVRRRFTRELDNDECACGCEYSILDS